MEMEIIISILKSDVFLFCTGLKVLNNIVIYTQFSTH